MSNIFGSRTEADYDVRLVDRVRTWESRPQNAAKAEELKLTAQRKIGMLKPPEAGSIRALVLEQAYREEVRAFKQWPTREAWLRGEE